MKFCCIIGIVIENPNNISVSETSFILLPNNSWGQSFSSRAPSTVITAI
jgi:hypothetical protein